MLFAKRQLLPYHETHENCARYLVYFVSRFAIVYNPVTHRQNVYEGHSAKISALAMHHMRFLAATGEAAEAPTIHLWNVLNCEPFKILKTYHRGGGILHLAFSRDGSLLLSIAADRYLFLDLK